MCLCVRGFGMLHVDLLFNHERLLYDSSKSRSCDVDFILIHINGMTKNRRLLSSKERFH